MKKLQDILVAVVFLAILLGVPILSARSPDAAMSQGERRSLTVLPEVTWKKAVSGVLFQQLEDYTRDQIVCREQFRSLKAHIQLDVLRLRDDDGFARQDGYYAPLIRAFPEDSVSYALERLRQIYELYLADTDTQNWFAIVPDKNLSLAREYGYPSPDYRALTDTFSDALPAFTAIDLRDTLTLEDYYRTDPHWRQERTGAAVEKIADAMGFRDRLTGQYAIHAVPGFVGTYGAMSAMDPPPETLFYLTSDTLDACTVYDYATRKTLPLYDLSRASGPNGYDLFLSGAQPLLRIDNPNASTDRELILFRDSFGSALAPLLAEGYQSVTVVDTRYMVPSAIGRFIDFKDQDVLFLYSTVLLENSFSLRQG